jgi:hypothetical protein
VILVLVVLALIGHAQAQTPSRLSFDSSGHFLIHGQPRFVRGVYDSGIGWYTDPSQWESVLFLPAVTWGDAQSRQHRHLEPRGDDLLCDEKGTRPRRPARQP